jgi:hypothetical protein
MVVVLGIATFCGRVEVILGISLRSENVIQVSSQY